MSGRGREEEAGARELEEMLEAALAQAALYQGEWTNFHLSDPGVVILENLTAFQALQRDGLFRTGDEIWEGLCRLAGYEREKAEAAYVWLLALQEGRHPELMPHQKLYAAGLCFEPEGGYPGGEGGLAGIFREADGKIEQMDKLRDERAPGDGYPFGERPKPGHCLYLVMKSLPEAGEWLHLLVRAKRPFPANRIPEEACSLFARLEWSLYTRNGYRRIEYRDTGGAFLQDGVISLKMPAEEGCPDRRLMGEGSALRCRLLRSDYDAPPRVTSLQGPLLAVRQKETLAVALCFADAEMFVAGHAMLEDGYVTVYALEEDGFYHVYEKQDSDSGQDADGGALYPESGKEPGVRYFRQEKQAPGVYRFTLTGGWAASDAGEDRPGAVVVVRSRALMDHYKVGRIYGCREEILSLQPICHILAQDFLLGVCMRDGEGSERYQFFRPGDLGRDALTYTLLEEEGAVRIEDAGACEEGELLICSCSVHRGERGNIRAGNLFYPSARESGAFFYNPLTGSGGSDGEDIAAMSRRMAADVRRPGGLVRETDYEEMIRRIPGLAVHKVKAFAGAQDNEVRIAVKPYSEQPFPVLSPIYRERILAEVEKRRMLATKVTLLSPIYVRVDVSGRIHLKPFSGDGRERVETTLRGLLDGISSDRNFGGCLSFREICDALEALDCVEEICRLILRPQPGPGIRMQGADIWMQEGALCYPGRLELEYGRKG